MKVQKILAAAAVFVAAGSVFAADAPAAAATVTATAATVAAGDIASDLNLPVVTINNVGGRSRADVRAEAVDAVKNHKTTLQAQLDQYK